MKRNLILLFTIAISVILFNGCKDEPCDDVECGANGVKTESTDGESCACVCNEGYEGANCETMTSAPIELTQEMLDGTATLYKSETGAGVFDIAHNGQPTGGDSTIRDIFTSDGTEPVIEPGAVITKHTYNLAKDTLFVTFAMVKHEAGYSSVSNDWEYVMMPFDETVDYTINPNGIFSKAAVSGVPAEDLNCVTCHNAAGGGDQLFSND